MVLLHPQKIGATLATVDAEGIGLQNMSDSIISHNRVIDGLGLTAAIGMWVNENSSGINNQYTYNYLENIYGSGVLPSGANNSGGHTVAYNIIINSGLGPISYGSGWGALRLQIAQSLPSKIYNNLLIDNDINIHLRGGSNNYEIFNNLSYHSDPTGLHVGFDRLVENNNNTLNNNLYFPDGATRFNQYSNGPWDLQGWIALTSQDTNSIVGDPRFVSSSAPYDFHLTANSPAIDPPINVQAVSALDLNNDYLDYDNQFMLWNPDIGPYEYQLSDTDADGVLDMTEICYDGDCSNYDPYNATTNPSGGDLNANTADTDGDGTSDGGEIAAGTDPLNSASDAAASAVSAPAMGLIALMLLWLGLIGIGSRFSKTHQDITV